MEQNNKSSPSPRACLPYVQVNLQESSLTALEEAFSQIQNQASTALEEITSLIQDQVSTTFESKPSSRISCGKSTIGGIQKILQPSSRSKLWKVNKAQQNTCRFTHYQSQRSSTT
ncbi:hypothetical protein ACFX19_020501 [Malus domestica]